MRQESRNGATAEYLSQRNSRAIYEPSENIPMWPKRILLSAGSALLGLLILSAPENSSAQGYNSIIQNLIQGAAPLLQQQGQAPAPMSEPYQYQQQPSPAYRAPQQYYQPQSIQSSPEPSLGGAGADTSSIIELQKELDDLGYNAGAPDGSWGGRSAAALRAFQIDHNLSPDGRPRFSIEHEVRLSWDNRPGQQPVTSSNEGPSFSCARASSPSELAICREPELADLDRQLAALYSSAKASPGAPPDLASQQKLWMIHRNACAGEVECLHQSMMSRIGELQGELRQPEGRGLETVQAGGMPSGPSGSSTKDIPVSNSTASDPLSSLVHPPAGLRPWPLLQLAGRLLLPARVPNTGYSEGLSETGADFFELLADTNLTVNMQRDITSKYPAFLASLLDDSNRQKYMSGESWVGNNELEQSDTQAAFARNIIPLIKQLAPKLPLTFLWSEPAYYSDYDTSRGGFPINTLTAEAGVTQLKLPDFLHDAGLEAKLTPQTPDLFWPVDRSTAEKIYHDDPDRSLELVASVDIGKIDPDTGEVALNLNALSLYPKGLTKKLYDYPLQHNVPDQGAGLTTTSLTAPITAAQTATDVAQRFGLPSINGIPWINGYSFNTNDLMMRASIEEGATLVRSWARTIAILGLAQTRNVNFINDEDAVALSCILFSEAEQITRFRHATCNNQTLQSPAAQFDLEDGAVAFRSQDIPRIQSEAPSLPFTLIYENMVIFGRYDEARHGFPLDTTSVRNGLVLFDSPVDVRVPNFWPATREEARQFLTMQPTAQSDAWMGMKISVVGAILGHAAKTFDADNGLPGDGEWRFRVDGIGLFQDKSLQTEVYAFPNAPHEAAISRPGSVDGTATPTIAVPVTPLKPLEDRMSGPPYGPDILGIKLGMRMSAAAAVVRSAVTVSREADTEVRLPRTVPANSATPPEAMLHGHLFVDDVSHEAVALFEAPHEDNGRVLGILRNVQVPAGIWGQLFPKMVAKYGQPARVSSQEAEWAASNSSTCAPAFDEGAEPQFTWMNGLSYTNGNVGPNIIPSTPLIINAFTPFSNCGPVIRIAGRKSFLKRTTRI